MWRKFIEGLAFGAGFGIAFLAIWYVSAAWMVPRLIGSRVHEAETHFPVPASADKSSSTSAAEDRVRSGKPFHELGIDEQIKQASAIAIARFEHAADGENKAIIREFLKKDPGVEIYYAVGDEYQAASMYPREHTRIGDGVVIFFEGSPAQMVLLMSYYGDRIAGLGDIPIELFRDKCRKQAP